MADYDVTQIHELEEFSGELGDSTFFPVDDGTETTKVSYAKMNARTNATCEKSGSVWTSGNLFLTKRNNIVQLTGSPVLTAVSARTAFATIPEGFRPAITVYAFATNSSEYFLFNTNGSVQTGGASQAGTKYFSAVWVVA